MRNFFQTTETIGTSGQPTREEFADIARQGYRTVINLAMHDSDYALADEGSVVASLGMTYIHLPVPFDAPTRDHLAAFMAFMRAVEAQKVWVHCAMNMRVSAFMYHYLVLDKGVTPAQAKNPILQIWEPTMAPAWRQFLALTQTGPELP
ncbi:MAG: protein tyrosine phosphatase family protein [Spongiibacteraceae bacterium]